MKTSLPTWLWGVIAVVIAIALGLLDWLTGYEMSFSVFYFLPVSLSAWFMGLGAAVTLSLFCTLLWFGVDFLSGHQYVSHFYAVWNTFIHLISFLVIGGSINKIRRQIEHERDTAAVLGKSLAETKVLEAILPICADCKKIRDKEGHWQQLDVYIRKHSNTQFSHGYCPECARKALIEANLLDKESE